MLSGSDALYRVGNCTIDATAHRVICNGVPMELKWRQFEALRLLIEANGSPVSKDEFFNKLWPDVTIDESSLTKLISQLRKVLEESDPSVEYLETVPGVGYRLAVSVERIGSQERAPPATKRRYFLGTWTAAAAALIVALPTGWWLHSQWQQRQQLNRQANAALDAGNQMIRKGDDEGAVKELQRAIQLNPRLAGAYSALAHALHGQGRHNVISLAYRSPSIEAAEQGVRIDPQCGTCQGTLGFFLYSHGWQWSRADYHLREAIRLEPDRESAPPMPYCLPHRDEPAKPWSKSTLPSQSARTKRAGSPYALGFFTSADGIRIASPRRTKPS